MAGLNIVVTGGTGFTGSALVFRLLNSGHKVKVIDNKKGLFYESLLKNGAQIKLGDIVDNNFVANQIKGSSIVFHLAAAFRELNVDNSHYFKVNVCGTKNLLQASEESGVSRFIYCSTQGVHGHIANPPGDENSPINPEDYYQQTKYEGELAVDEYLNRGLNTIIIRPTAIYGPGDPGRFFMIFKKVKSGSFPIFGTGSTYYHPVYIDNLVDAFMLAMNPEVGRGQTYIIADEEYVTIKELVRKIGEVMNVSLKLNHYPLLPLIISGHVMETICKPFHISPPIFPRRVDWYRQVRAFRINKAKEELGYYPKINLDMGLKMTYEWYKENGFFKITNNAITKSK